MGVRPKGFIENYKPTTASRALIERISAILVEYAAFLPLTVRQIFYRLVGTGDGYEKTDLAYKRLVDLIGNSRRGGMIGFDAIRDDGMTREDAFDFTGVDDFLSYIERRFDDYLLNRQIGQPFNTIVGCEAGGMVPQLASVAHSFGVPVISGGGFDSITAKHDLAQEIAGSERPVRLLHIGDLDPSGVHLFSSLGEDLRGFLNRLNPDVGLETERVAVLPEHVARFGLQTVPKKAGDTKSFAGVGSDPNATVQVEALAPDQLAGLVTAAIERHWDTDAQTALEAREEEEKERVRNWLERSLRRRP